MEGSLSGSLPQQSLNADVSLAKRHKPDHPEGERTSDNATEGLDLSSTLETRPRLSLTVEDGMRKLTASKELIDAQLVEVQREGLTILENLKRDFIAKLDRIRVEFDGYKDQQVESWLEISAESQDAEAKLEKVITLLNQLSAATTLQP